MGSAAVRAIVVWLLAPLLNVRYLKEGAGPLSSGGPPCSRHISSPVYWFQMSFLSRMYLACYDFRLDLAPCCTSGFIPREAFSRVGDLLTVVVSHCQFFGAFCARRPETRTRGKRVKW